MPVVRLATLKTACMGMEPNLAPAPFFENIIVIQYDPQVQESGIKPENSAVHGMTNMKNL